MAQLTHMNVVNRINSRYSTYAAYIIAFLLFLVPFFWLKPGFVNLGGDGGRLYFLDPLAVARSSVNYSNSAYGYSFSYLPYLYFLYGLLQILRTPTNLIAFEHGLNLSLGFLYVFLIMKNLISSSKKTQSDVTSVLAGIVAGLAYIGMITKTGWPVALPTLNQIFLNVVIFYYLLRYCQTEKIRNILILLIVTLCYSINFGLGNAPQLLSFFPISFLFIFLYMRFIVHKSIPWKGLLILLVVFLGLHSFHLLPILMSLISPSSTVHSQVFSESAIKNAGLFYFSENHSGSGKISRELFQWWLGKDIFIFLIPMTVVAGFIVKKSKLLFLIGCLFLLTFFLVSANITHIGIELYKLLFHIPGFSMFRSFNEKWFYVFAFYYSLAFGISIFYLFEKSKLRLALIACVTISVIFSYRMQPFLRGDILRSTLYLSDSVSSVFSVDPDLSDSLQFLKSLPEDGKVLTLPLTFPYFQVAYGKNGGAYEGISMVSQIANRQDFTGFWTFGPYEIPMIDAVKKQDFKRFVELASLLNIRYIFRNSDERIMNKFPGYPYVPVKTYESKNDLPAIKDQLSYDIFIKSLPVTSLYTKGFYSIYEIDTSVVRPLIYIPDYVSSDANFRSEELFKWALLEKKNCSILPCDSLNKNPPVVTYKRRSDVSFDVSIDLRGQREKFALIFSQPYVSTVALSLEGKNISDNVDHILVNDYANGWIINPTSFGDRKILTGKIYLQSQDNYYTGIIISVSTGIGLCVYSLYLLYRKQYEKI